MEHFSRRLPSELRKATLERTPPARLGTPGDVADVVAFLASDDARWVTGQILDASRGYRA